MRVAIIADIHEHRELFMVLLQKLEEIQPEYMLLLGDYGAPSEITRKLLKLHIPIYAIWGNNDGEVYKTIQYFHKYPHATIGPKSYDWIALDGKNIFLTHYDDLVEPMAKSGLYDAVFYGHNHTAKEEMIGNTLVVNPGAVRGGHTPPSFAMWDTQSMQIQFIEL